MIKSDWYFIEKFNYKGYWCLVVFNKCLGHRCGYVLDIPENIDRELIEDSEEITFDNNCSPWIIEEYEGGRCVGIDGAHHYHVPDLDFWCSLPDEEVCSEWRLQGEEIYNLKMNIWPRPYVLTQKLIKKELKSIVKNVIKHCS